MALDTEILDTALDIIDAANIPFASAADLACGDGEILDYINCDQKVYGDIFPGKDLEGTYDDNLALINYVHLLIMTYQFHVLPDPLATLYAARQKAAWLLVTDWADTKMSVQDMTETMEKAGFQPEYANTITTPDGNFYVWLCRNLFYRAPE